MAVKVGVLYKGQVKADVSHAYLTKTKLIISLQCEYTGEYSRKEL